MYAVTKFLHFKNFTVANSFLVSETGTAGLHLVTYRVSGTSNLSLLSYIYIPNLAHITFNRHCLWSLLSPKNAAECLLARRHMDPIGKLNFCTVCFIHASMPVYILALLPSNCVVIRSSSIINRQFLYISVFQCSAEPKEVPRGTEGFHQWHPRVLPNWIEKWKLNNICSHYRWISELLVRHPKCICSRGSTPNPTAGHYIAPLHP